MHREDLLRYLDPTSFRPFRITMNSGRTFDVGHPENLTVLRWTALVFDKAADGVLENWHEISLLLIQEVRKQDAAAPSNGQAGG